MIRKLFVGFIALSVIGCGGSSGGGDAFLRVVHGSPDAPAVDALINDLIVLSGVIYPQASGYNSVVPGEHQYKN